MEKFNYDFHHTRKPEDYLVYLKRFRGNPQKILEMGSGIGLFLQLCVQEGIDAIGLEYESEGVDFSTERGLTAIQHDLGNPMPFDSNIFDAVFSNQVIEHLLPDAQINMINEAFRVLKSGGQALIISPCRHFEPARLDKYHIGLLTPSEIKQMALKAGFIDINMGYNRCQPVPPIPYDLISALFKAFNTPDLLSQDACLHCYKPL
ncbi:class I SAM-dependent methyltransferase [Limnospira platensis CENA597]|uniref:class I SAM-dependent methyltransferase n=1 Tax=Limnospira platensis TaxID=118562 RepID=UPI003DA01654